MADPYSPPPPVRNPPQTFELNKPTIVALLHLVGVISAGLINIGAVVLAYMWKEAPDEPWMQSHFSYNIRTFWYSILMGLVGVLTAVIGVGFIILALVAAYIAIRAILALAAAQRREPIRNPEAVLM